MRAWENWWVCESVWVCVRDIFVNAHTNGNNQKRPATRFHLWTSEVHKWSAFWTCILPEPKSCVLGSAKRILLPTFSFMRFLGLKKSKQTHTNSKIWIEIIIYSKINQWKNIKRRERDKKKKISFFLFNGGGLGDSWSMSFGLFRSHWKYFIRPTHARLSRLWDP